MPNKLFSQERPLILLWPCPNCDDAQQIKDDKIVGMVTFKLKITKHDIVGN